MQTTEAIRRDNTTFALLSFEGPDHYSRVGRLGERVSNLAETLARMGFETHLLFVGDPSAPGHEVICQGRLHLHRWCQWISQYHPEGCYQAEDEKLWDFSGSVPSFVIDEIAKRSALKGKMVVIQGEEWHSADAICRIADLAYRAGLGDRVLTLWNANDVRCFDRIDWPRLARSASITTVSRYMKHVMWKLGVNPLVIPNGIPRRLLLKSDERKVTSLRKAFGDGLLLVKVADWLPSKRWKSAVEAVSLLMARGVRSTLIAGGDLWEDEARRYQGEVTDLARALGLDVANVEYPGKSLDQQIGAIVAVAAANVIRINFPMSEDLVRILYSAGDGVLANSDHEAFGLQALEAMAAGGVVFTGCTGEDYADPLVNAIVLETDGADEIVEYAMYLLEREDEKERIRLSGRATAQRHAWEEVVGNLVAKIEYLRRIGAAERRALVHVPHVSWPVHLPLSSATLRSLYQKGHAQADQPASDQLHELNPHLARRGDN